MRRHTFRIIAARGGVRDGIVERIMGHTEDNDFKEPIHTYTTKILKSRW